jgi:plastocyanin
MKTIVLCILVSAVTGFFGIAPAGTITGKITAKGAKNGGNAVIYIDKIKGKTFEPPKEHALMDQKNLSFIPHVLPILVGTTVDFLNSDDVLHNVFSPDQCAGKFNLGSWPKGKTKSYTFKEPGCTATLLCNVHPEMEGFVVVVETPYYAVSNQDGTYSIKDVPAGKYTLKIWHERLKGKEVQIDVPEKGDVTANFEIHR